MNIIKSLPLYIGGTLLLLSAIIKPLKIMVYDFDITPYIMGLGTLLLAVYWIIVPIQGSDKPRIIRLQIQLAFSIASFCLATYWVYVRSPYWVYALLTGAIIELVVSFRISSQK